MTKTSRMRNGLALCGVMLLTWTHITAGSPIISWTEQISGHTENIGISNRQLDVYHDGTAVMTSSDGNLYYRAAGSSTWTEIATWDGGERRDSIAISQPDRIHVGLYDGGASGNRRVRTFKYDAVSETWSTGNRAPSGSNDRVQGLWAEHGSGLQVVATVQGAGMYYDATGEGGAPWTAADTDPVGREPRRFSQGSLASNLIGLTAGMEEVLRSTDGGQNWTETAALPANFTHTGDAQAVTAYGANLHWVGGINGQVVVYDASDASPSYALMNTPATGTVRSLWAVSATSVWGVTTDQVIHFDGTSWGLVTTGFEGDFSFYNVAADGEGNVTIAGSGGNVIYGVIPEPGTVLLLGAGLFTVLLSRRRLLLKN